MRYLILIAMMFFTSVCHSATYYLDQVNGLDTNDGSESSPWQTFTKSVATVTSGDTIIMETGDYGNYTEVDTVRTDWVSYQSAEGAEVHVDYLRLDHTVDTDTYLRFTGIEFLPDWVDPDGGNTGADDPQYAESTQATYAKTATPFYWSKSSYVEIIDSVISGQNKHLTTEGAYIKSGRNILISGCEVTKVRHALRFIDTASDVTVVGNHIHDIAGTGINNNGLGFTDMVYERNHIHDGLYSDTEDYAPRADGANVHSSGISIRDGNTTIRGNIIHQIGTSGGIRFYEDEPATGSDYVNDNMLVENNLLYDLHTDQPFNMYELGPNVVIRNNTIIGTSRDVNGGEVQYKAAFAAVTEDNQNGPAALQVYNNIFIGPSNLTNSKVADEGNNIVWSAWSFCTGDAELASTDHVMTCSYSDYPWDELDDLWPNDPSPTDLSTLFDSVIFLGVYIDFTLDTASLAYNFGDASEQPTTSLGTLDANNEFILDNGATRTSSLHSAGAYEFGTVQITYPLYQDAAGNLLQ